MKVYRYLRENELNSFLNSDMDNIGSEYSQGSVSNTHKYKEGVKYLHFFARIEDLQSIRDLKRKSQDDFYVCRFDIPFLTLLTNKGKGYYECSGYDVPYNVIKEYAIPTDMLKPEHLTAYVKDQDRELPIENIQQALACQSKDKDMELKTTSTKENEICQ